MDWIANNSLVLGIGLLLVTAGMVWGWIQTTNKRLLFGAAVPLLLAVAVLVIDQVYESPEEQVRRELFAVVEAIENDDVDATLAAFVPEAETERAAVKQWFRVAKIRDISIKNNLEIKITRSGRRASAEFNVTAMATSKRGEFNRKGAFFFIVYYERDGDRWLIEDYEQMSAEKGFQRRDGD